MINVVLHKPIIDALLFSLAIAVGITPQLLPAVVSTSLAAGSRRMAARKVLVKRLVCIEDLGDIDVLFTDKTGTLTQGRIGYMRAVPASTADRSDAAAALGPAVHRSVADDGHRRRRQPARRRPCGTHPPPRPPVGDRRLPRGSALLPFDHERRMVSVLVGDAHGTRTLVAKGAPETCWPAASTSRPARAPRWTPSSPPATGSSRSPPATLPTDHR